MVQITIGNNVNRQRAIEDGNQTVRELLEKYDIDYSRGATTLDGTTIQPGQMDMTLTELGVTDRCFLLNVAKTDNA